MVKVDLDKLILIDLENREHQLFNHEFWNIAPSINNWSQEMGRIPPYLFSMLLHNAKKDEGIVPAMTDLLKGIELKNEKSGGAKLAEDLLEKIRLKSFPKKPSRLRCHYLNYNKQIAYKRKNEWNWQHCVVERCYLILSSGFFHYGDITIYEKLTKNPHDYDLARSYWTDFVPTTENEFMDLEILADSGLYFPDWKEFEEIDIESLISYQKKYLNNT